MRNRTVDLAVPVSPNSVTTASDIALGLWR
jgi:hypothetical protein